MQGTQLNGHKEDNPWKNTQKILFIRHGESEAHVGIAADYIESVRLTLLGKAKAQEIANGLPNAPDRIITSPYLRAWETAYPTRLRFPDTPVEVWPEVREFTYLGSLAGKYLTKQERSGKVIDYWNRYKPVEKDGEGESFVELIDRARAVLQKLKKIDGFVVIFTHEQFIRAVQSVLEGWVEKELERLHMRRFREMLLADPMPYGYVMKMFIYPESWKRSGILFEINLHPKAPSQHGQSTEGIPQTGQSLEEPFQMGQPLSVPKVIY